MLNQVVLVGKISSTPIIKEFGNNNQMAILLLEVNKAYQSPDKENEPDLFQIVLWKSVLKNNLELCLPEAIVGIRGKLQANNFVSKEGNRYYSCDIIAERISFLSE